MLTDSLTVGELMTTHVVTIGMDESLQDAQRIFNHRRFHHLVVLEHGKPVGVVSDRDLLKNLSPFIGTTFSERPQDVATRKKRIHQIMTRQLVWVPPECPAIDAAQVMINHNVSCLPVIDDHEHLAGILTMRDLIKWAAGIF